MADKKNTVSFDEWANGAEVKPAKTGILGRAGDLGLSALKSAIAVPETAVGLANLVSGGKAGKAVESAGIRFKDAKDILDAQKSDAAKDAEWRFQNAEGFTGKLGAAVENPSLIANTLVESAAPMLAGGVVGRGLSMAAPRLAGYAGAIGEGAIGAGSAAEQIRQESADGELSGKQAALAGASGLATGLLGYGGSKLAGRLGVGDIDTALAGGARTAGVQAGKEAPGMLKRIGGGALSEGVFEELPQSVSEQMLQNVALDRDPMQGVDAAAAMGLLSGGLMGGGMGVVSGQPKQQAAPAQPPVAPSTTPGAPPAATPPAGRTLGESLTSTPMADLMGGGDLTGGANPLQAGLSTLTSNNKMYPGMDTEPAGYTVDPETGAIIQAEPVGERQMAAPSAQVEAPAPVAQAPVAPAPTTPALGEILTGTPVADMLDTRTPSQRMGLNQAAGGLTAAAAIAVDSGASPVTAGMGLRALSGASPASQPVAEQATQQQAQPPAQQPILNNGKPFTLAEVGKANQAIGGTAVSVPGGWAIQPPQPTQQPSATPATAMPTAATPAASAQSAILGRNSQPIAEGGQPFATREEAKAEKRMQPLMRVAPAEGGGFILKPASDRQLAAVEKAAKRLKYPSTGETGPRSLHGFILQIGGLASGAMPDVGFDLNPRVGNRRLFSPRGKTIEQAAMAAKQEGYIQDEDENTLIEALKRSLNVSPVYTPDGYEAMAEAQMQARYEDFLAAEQDGGAENDWSHLTPEELADTGYNDYDEATQAEIRALVAQAEALGVDAESILEDVAQRTENATQKDYENAAKSAIEAAIRSSEESRSRDLGQASAEAGPATADTQADPAAVTDPASDIRARNLAALKARMMGQKKPIPTTPPAPNQQATQAPEAGPTNQGATNGQGQETLLKAEQPTGAAAMVSGAPVADTSLNRDSSWIIREKATGKVVMETFDRAKVDALNAAKYEAVPIQQHLAEQGAKKPSDTTKPGGFTENVRKAAGKVDAPKKSAVEAAKEYMGDKFEASTDDFSAVNRLLGKDWESAYVGENEATKRHVADMVADENLKSAPLEKIKKRSDAIRKKIADSISNEVARFDPTSIGGRGAAGRSRDRARATESRAVLKSEADRLDAEIARRAGDAGKVDAAPAQPSASIDGIVIRPGKGLIKGKFKAEVDGVGLPGDAFNTEQEAYDAALKYREVLAKRANEGAEAQRRRDAIAESFRNGDQVTNAQIESLGLKPDFSDMRWFMSTAADLFGLNSRQIRPIVKDLIKVRRSDMGTEYKYVPTRKALEAIAASQSQSSPAKPLTSLDRGQLERDFRTYPTKVLEGVIANGGEKALLKAAGVKSAYAFDDLPVDDGVKAYVAYVEAGGAAVDGLPVDYNEWVLAQERDAESRRMQSTRTIRQKNGKPFRSEDSARKEQDRFNLKATHKIAAVTGGFELQQMSIGEQIEARRIAEGRESYDEAQTAVLAEMGITGETPEGDIDATEAQWVEIERRVDARLRGESILTSPTKADFEAQQARAEQAAKAKAAQDKADTARAAKERERKEVAAASVAAADTFELGQDAMANLTGQQDVFGAMEQEAKPTQPKATELTPKQFHEAKLAFIAADTGASMADVRENYDTEAGRAENNREWAGQVERAAKAGDVLTSKTLDKLYELAPNVRLPETAIPQGYQRPEARKAEAEDKQARVDGRKAAKAGVKDAAPSFTDLEKELQAQSHATELDGDIGIVAGGGVVRYVSLDDAVSAAKKAIEVGVKAVPFQIHNATGIRIGDVDRVLGQVNRVDYSKRSVDWLRQNGGDTISVSDAIAALVEKQKAITGDVKNWTERDEKGHPVKGIALYNDSAAKKLDAISWAITNLMGHRKKHGDAPLNAAKAPDTDENKVPLSSVIDKVNAKNGQGLTDEDLVPNQKPSVSRAKEQPLTPASTIRAAITKAYGTLLDKLEAKGLVTIAQTEREAIEAAAQARADKTGVDVEQIKRQMLASVQMQRVWHGSPHRGIQQFSTEKIGTGEGAQAYGWGLYFANQKDVADFYRRNLSGLLKTGNQQLDDILVSNGGDLQKSISELRQMEESSPPSRRGIWTDALYVAIELDRSGALIRNGGQLYEVEIPEDSDMLLWDKPLSEQPKNVLAALRRGYEEQGGDYPDKSATPKTGREIYNDFRALAGGFESMDQRAASEYLASLGIKGIKYLDGTSRNAGDGSFNYVVFDGSDTQIVDVKYSANGNIEGFFDKQTGKSFLVADNLTAASAPGTLMHEVGIHMAADGKLEPLFKRAGTLLKTGTQNEFIQRVKARMARAGETSDEEAAAYIATEYENNRLSAPVTVGKWLADLTAAVRAWLFSKGIILKADQLTVADIAAVARANARSMARGGPNGGPGGWQAFSRTSLPATLNIDGKDRPTTNSKGQHIHPTEEGVRNFYRWFGDSRVVDEQGRPLVVYHGTAYSFDEFDPGMAGATYGADDEGIFFTTDTEEADVVSIDARNDDNEDQSGSNVMPVFLSIKNPLTVSFDEFSWQSWEIPSATNTYDSHKERILSRFRAGDDDWNDYDGIVITGKDKHKTFVAFNPNQIKSATGNTGAFSPTDPDIRFSRAADMAGNAIDKAKQTADKAMGKDFPRAASMPDLNDDQRSLLGKVGASQSPASDAIKAATDRAGLKIRQGMVDRFAALKELDEKALGQNFIADSITNSAWVLAKMSSAGAGALNAMMKAGRIEMDAQQKVIGLKGAPNGGLTASLQKLGGPAEVERFFAWVAANRAEKLMGEGRENLFTPAEIAAGKTLNTGTTEGGKVRPALYSQVHAEFQQYRDDVLAIAEQAGIINSENRAMWRDEFYVPFYRVMEDDADRGRSGGNGLSRQEAYKKLKGGKQNLNDLMENTLMNFHHLLSASLKNQAAVQAIKNAEHVGIARKVPEARRDTKTSTFVLVDGKKVFYEVDDPLVFESITALADPGLNNTAVRVMGAFKRLFTNMTTATPQFIIANTFRDLLQASATSPTSKNIAKNLKEGIQSYRDEKTRAEMLASGGAFSFGHIYGMGADEVKASLLKTVAGAGLISSPSMIPSILRKGWDAWGDITDLSENASRAATYAQNVEQIGKLRAAFEARDVMDFSQHGAWPAVRLLVRIVPFLNARLQGLDKLYRSGLKPSILTAMGKGTDTDKQAAARFAMVTGALTLATMALYLVNADDDEYKKLEEWQKDTYWFIRIGENAFFLPKPFEVGAIATMAERTLQQAMDDKATGKLFRERMWEMLMQTFAFNPTPQMFQPLIDVYSNKDAFTGRDIESAGMERMSTGLRSRDTTTAPATALSAVSRVFGDESAIAVSPVQADHLIKGYLGGVGATAAGWIDTMYRAATGQSSPDKAWSEYQPIRRFYRDLDVPVANTRYTTLFYDGLKEANRVYADVMELQKLGRTEDAQALATEKRSVLQMRIALNAQQRRLTEINNRMKEVRRSDKDGEWKRREIDLLNTKKELITERMGKMVESSRVAAIP